MVWPSEINWWYGRYHSSANRKQCIPAGSDSCWYSVPFGIYPMCLNFGFLLSWRLKRLSSVQLLSKATRKLNSYWSLMVKTVSWKFRCVPLAVSLWHREMCQPFEVRLMYKGYCLSLCFTSGFWWKQFVYKNSTFRNLLHQRMPPLLSVGAIYLFFHFLFGPCPYYISQYILEEQCDLSQSRSPVEWSLRV